MTTKPQLLITATASGSGKTTFTLGLLRVLQRRGLRTQSFKCGPDYIDPKYHELASGGKSTNLDLYMMSPAHIQELYHHEASDADAVVVEGVMGLFDGYERMKGSSAEIAHLLQIPTILLVNAGSSAYSTGAIIYGFKHFRPEVKIAGVVFNRVASENHYSYLRDAAEDAGVPALGYIPKAKSLQVPSRHLGLSIQELEDLNAFPDEVADLIEQHVDVDRLLQLCSVPFVMPPKRSEPLPNRSLRIAVARDAAFNFIYPENIHRLAQLGQLIYFSPIKDTELPQADLIYFPGGYPEFYLPELEANQRMREQIRAYAESGGRIIAECGGMMYLCQSIVDEAGEVFSMCGVLPHQATMEQMKLRLGYREVEVGRHTFRGHEFHYSHLIESGEVSNIAHQRSARGDQVETPLYRIGNVIAGYTHLYWGEQNPLDLFK